SCCVRCGVRRSPWASGWFTRPATQLPRSAASSPPFAKSRPPPRDAPSSVPPPSSAVLGVATGDGRPHPRFGGENEHTYQQALCLGQDAWGGPQPRERLRNPVADIAFRRG